MKPQDISKKHIKLRAFSLFLVDATKDWLYYLAFSLITYWNDMKRLFLEKIFPTSRVAI